MNARVQPVCMARSRVSSSRSPAARQHTTFTSSTLRRSRSSGQSRMSGDASGLTLPRRIGGARGSLSWRRPCLWRALRQRDRQGGTEAGEEEDDDDDDDDGTDADAVRTWTPSAPLCLIPMLVCLHLPHTQTHSCPVQHRATRTRVPSYDF